MFLSYLCFLEFFLDQALDILKARILNKIDKIYYVIRYNQI